MHEVIREQWEAMLSLLEEGRPVVVASDSYGLPTLHSFYKQDPEKTERYRQTIKHLGFGHFRGETENGQFGFCGGGAMSFARDPDGDYISWSEVTGTPEVLADLDFDLEEEKEIIRKILG